MCFGGGETPQQPVNPAPYPWAEVTTTNAEPAEMPKQEEQPTQPRTPRPRANRDTGENTSGMGGGAMNTWM